MVRYRDGFDPGAAVGALAVLVACLRGSRAPPCQRATRGDLACRPPGRSGGVGAASGGCPQNMMGTGRVVPVARRRKAMPRL
jgi:hypothetical protein